MDELKIVAEKIRRKQVIPWLGSGFNYTAGVPMGGALAEKLIASCTAEQRQYFASHGQSLPDVAEEFELLRGRNDLLALTRDSLRVASPDLTLHQSFKRIVQLREIITTNYDHLFELCYGDALAPVYSDHTTAISSSGDKIRYYKIHGDIDHSDLVITRGDYTRFLTNRADWPLWKIVSSLATRYSILFIGYGFSDQNAQFLFEQISGYLGKLTHQSFLVSPNIPPHKQSQLHKCNMGVTELPHAVHRATRVW